MPYCSFFFDKIDMCVQSEAARDVVCFNEIGEILEHRLGWDVFALLNAICLFIHGKIGMLEHAEKVVRFQAWEDAMGSPWAADTWCSV